MFPLYRNPSIHLHCKPIDCFLYGGNIGRSWFNVYSNVITMKITKQPLELYSDLIPTTFLRINIWFCFKNYFLEDNFWKCSLLCTIKFFFLFYGKAMFFSWDIQIFIFQIISSTFNLVINLNSLLVLWFFSFLRVYTGAIVNITQKIEHYPAGNYMSKVNKRNTRARCEICSDLTMKIPERRSSVSMVHFE